MAASKSEAVTMKYRMVTTSVSRFSFSLDCPPEWAQLEIPTETPNFEDPGAFMPQAVLMSPVGAILFSVAARPAFADGSVIEWAQFLLKHHNMEFTQLMPGTLNGVQCIRAMATQASDAGPMQLAVAFFEDGGSIIHVTAMAPQQLWGSVEPMFNRMFDSFVFIKTQGASHPLVPSQTPPIRDTKFIHLALSDEATTLTDSDEKMNAYMRDNGIGLLPRVMKMNEAERYAMMACGSIMAAVPVPFGWHIFDDGKRALVFTADNAIQINLSVIPTGGMTIDQGMDQIVAGMLKEQPQVEHQRHIIEGMPMLAFKKLNINGEELTQVFIFRERPKREGYVFQTRVTSSDADMVRAVDLGGMIVQKSEFFE